MLGIHAFLENSIWKTALLSCNQISVPSLEPKEELLKHGYWRYACTPAARSNRHHVVHPIPSSPPRPVDEGPK